MGRRKPDENVTFRLDPDVMLWARARALVERTSVNRVVARLLEEYARIPAGWLAGLPPPWDDSATPDGSATGDGSAPP